MPVFVMLGRIGPEGLKKRSAVRPLHVEYVQALDREGRIRFAGPFFADDGETPAGSLVIFDAPDLVSAREHCAGDPYVRDGVLESWELRPLTQVFPEI